MIFICIYIYMFGYTRLYVYIQCIYTYIWCALGGQPNPWAQEMVDAATGEQMSPSFRAEIRRCNYSKAWANTNAVYRKAVFLETVCVKKVMCQNYIYYIWINMQLYEYDEYNDYIIDINGFYWYITESVSRFSACLRAATLARPTQRLRTWPRHPCVAKLNAPCGRLRLTSAHNCKISIVWIIFKYYMHILSLYYLMLLYTSIFLNIYTYSTHLPQYEFIPCFLVCFYFLIFFLGPEDQTFWFFLILVIVFHIFVHFTLPDRLIWHIVVSSRPTYVHGGHGLRYLTDVMDLLSLPFIKSICTKGWLLKPWRQVKDVLAEHQVGWILWLSRGRTIHIAQISQKTRKTELYLTITFSHPKGGPYSTLQSPTRFQYHSVPLDVFWLSPRHHGILGKRGGTLSSQSPSAVLPRCHWSCLAAWLWATTTLAQPWWETWIAWSPSGS